MIIKINNNEDMAANAKKPAAQIPEGIRSQVMDSLMEPRRGAVNATF